MFCCQYCGKTPPQTTLEVDHIIPVKLGGQNLVDNLITSCFDCNRGKAANPLTTLPQQTSDKAFILKEKEDQYKAYQKLQKLVNDRVNKETEMVEIIFKRYFEDKIFSERFKTGTVKQFIIKRGYQEIAQAMEVACGKIHNAEQALKYFCGICWNKINGKSY